MVPSGSRSRGRGGRTASGVRTYNGQNATKGVSAPGTSSHSSNPSATHFGTNSHQSRPSQFPPRTQSGNHSGTQSHQSPRSQFPPRTSGNHSGTHSHRSLPSQSPPRIQPVPALPPPVPAPEAVPPPNPNEEDGDEGGIPHPNPPQQNHNPNVDYNDILDRLLALPGREHLPLLS
ncbi:PREDICTED: protein SCAR-like [Camelina sativa]|uniref:Protein SCAR-like n=1 Tax=Camelina sativa TaxID=90675 RepID=A0ABM0T0H4_CAMSA|nr:PREDICTED: protein SCAR-like [Camelina sativa]